MSIDRVDKQNKDYDNQVIKIKDNQGNEQQVRLSVFVEGMAIAADTQSALSLFDSNKDGKINADEADALKKAISDCAGNDKSLDDNEILKIFNVENATEKASGILKQFKTMVERQFKGNLSTTVSTKDGREIKSDFNRDGSGTTVTKESNGSIITITYGAGKVIQKKEIIDSEGKKTVIEYGYDGGDKPTKITTKSYNKLGRLKETTTVNQKYNEETGKLESSEKYIKEVGKKTRKLTTTYQYDPESGKLVDEYTEEPTGKPISINGKMVEPKNITNIHYDYDENGKVAKKTTTKKPSGVNVTAEFKDGKIQKQTTTENKLSFKLENGKLVPYNKKSSSIMEYSYHENGNKKELKVHSEDSYGKASDFVYEYDENGKLKSATKSYYKRGAFVEAKYTGANLNNRVSGGVANEVIEYEDAEKTKVKQRTVNIFDKDGILIGDEIYDGAGNKIAEHDFSMLDGKFDTAYQKGRGDCYLLAAINSLASSEQGVKLLQDSISQDGENFVIKFPGAKIARDKLIKNLKAKDSNFDVSKINIPDQYTITPEELREAMLKSGTKYSIGDKDVLLLEIAYEKYREAVAETLDENNLKPSDYIKGFNLNLDGDDYLSAGTGSEAIFILTGKTSEVYLTSDYKNTPVCYVDSDYQMHITNPSGQIVDAGIISKGLSTTTSANNIELINKLKQATKDGSIQKYAATAAFRVSSQEVNGKILKDSNHALTIKSVTDDQVILANPWNPDTDVVMSMDDFLKAAYMIEVASLDDKDDTSVDENPVNNNGNGQTPTPPMPENHNVNVNNTQNYTVPEGKGFTTLIREKLVEQGIKPTKENIQKAKAQFKAANPGAVKVYNGKRQEWRGNEYLLKGAKVHIPEFKKDADGNVL